MIIEFGDVAVAAGGAYSSKPRPVLVFQDTTIFTGESVVVIPFTSFKNPAIKTRLSITPTQDNGLDRACYLEVDKISAIDRSCIAGRIGRLTEKELEWARLCATKLLRL